MLNDDSIKGVIANFRDVSDSKTAIVSLSQEREDISKLQATSSGLIYSMRYNDDGTLYFSYASDALEDTYGVKFDEIEYDSSKFLI
jgi:hypothetical protein